MAMTCNLLKERVSLLSSHNLCHPSVRTAGAWRKCPGTRIEATPPCGLSHWSWHYCYWCYTNSTISGLLRWASSLKDPDNPGGKLMTLNTVYPLTHSNSSCLKLAGISGICLPIQPAKCRLHQDCSVWSNKVGKHLKLHETTGPTV